MNNPNSWYLIRVLGDLYFVTRGPARPFRTGAFPISNPEPFEGTMINYIICIRGRKDIFFFN